MTISKKMALFSFWLIMISICQVTYGDEIEQKFDDPVVEARVQRLLSELRCLVCQNQSIEDSDASLAHDLRLLVRSKVGAGASDGEIKQYLKARYGEFILLRPTFSSHNLLLWLSGPIALTLGGLWIWYMTRKGKPRHFPNQDG